MIRQKLGELTVIHHINVFDFINLNSRQPILKSGWRDFFLAGAEEVGLFKKRNYMKSLSNINLGDVVEIGSECFVVWIVFDGAVCVKGCGMNLVVPTEALNESDYGCWSVISSLIRQESN